MPQQWSDYQDAYGPAVGIPVLLQQLSRDPVTQTKPADEPWFTLWSSLCHQGDVYTASYAAVPRIAQIAFDNADKASVNMNFFLLPASIEIARVNRKGPEIPKEVEAQYRKALKELGRVAAKYESADDMYLRKAAQAARLVGEGRVAEAEQLLESE